MLKMEDFNYILVGNSLAKRLKLNVGDNITIFGVLSDRYIQVRIKGIFVSNSVFDDEVLSPLYVAQWLRGTSYSYVTLIRVKVDEKTVNTSAILKFLGNYTKEATKSKEETQVSSWNSIMPIVGGSFSTSEIGIVEVNKLMESYISKYGITRDSILVLSVMIFIFSSMNVFVVSRIIVAQHKDIIEVLRSLGVSRKLLKFDLLVKVIPFLFFSSLAGILLSIALLILVQKYNYL